jgi:hypothetical protein
MFTLFRRTTRESASLRERRRWAGSIERLLQEADRPDGWRDAHGIRPVYEPQVLRACALPLRQIRDVLLDTSVEVPTGHLRRLWMFTCEGSVSSLLGYSPEAAHRGAVELRSAFVMLQPPHASAETWRAAS